MQFEIWWLLAFTLIMTTLVGVYRLALAYLDRRGRGAIPGDLEQRLARIEYAVESTAIEVERIGEGQRFLTSRLSERPEGRDAAMALPAERVITPH